MTSERKQMHRREILLSKYLHCPTFPYSIFLRFSEWEVSEGELPSLTCLGNRPLLSPWNGESAVQDLLVNEGSGGGG